MPEFHQNLWAPWRMEYIRSLTEAHQDAACFLCSYWAEPANDASHHVVWRKPSTFAVMNRFPYTNGHLLIAHAAHKAEFTELTDGELSEMTRALRDAVHLLRKAIGAQAFNVGFNLGRCAGAGLPGHLHAHVVPRWPGDTNFMAVVGDVRVLSDSLDASYAELVTAAKESGLRG